jgi:DNA-binding LytR/AlgR family response regulator
VTEPVGSPEAPLTEPELDRRVLLRVTGIAALFMLAVGFVNASTLITDAQRAGVALDPRVPWLLEYTSIAVILALVPLVAFYERRFPLDPDHWLKTIVAHVVGSIVYSAVHITVMILVRKAVFALFLGESYSFFDDAVTDILYEYRKDALTYAIVILMLNLMRGLEEHRREAQVARIEAKASGRLTLKSGGRTLLVDAKTVEWAQAAANYVEIRANGRTQLARVSLSALEEQMEAAGVDVARIHRSFIVNRAKVIDIAPSGDGDFKVRMADGSELKGSRRHRHNLPG